MYELRCIGFASLHLFPRRTRSQLLYLCLSWHDTASSTDRSTGDASSMPCARSRGTTDDRTGSNGANCDSDVDVDSYLQHILDVADDLERQRVRQQRDAEAAALADLEDSLRSCLSLSDARLTDRLHATGTP